MRNTCLKLLDKLSQVEVINITDDVRIKNTPKFSITLIDLSFELSVALKTTNMINNININSPISNLPIIFTSYITI